MEGESSVTGSIIDEIHSSDIQQDQIQDESLVLLEVSSINFILGISKEIKWKVSVMLLEVSLMKFILGISKETKEKIKARCYSKNHR